MKMTLTPTRDTDNSYPTEENSGVAFTRTQKNTGARTVSVTLRLRDGHALTFCADELGATLRALGVL